MFDRTVYNIFRLVTSLLDSKLPRIVLAVEHDIVKLVQVTTVWVRFVDDDFCRIFQDICRTAVRRLVKDDTKRYVFPCVPDFCVTLSSSSAVNFTGQW